MRTAAVFFAAFPLLAAADEKKAEPGKAGEFVGRLEGRTAEVCPRVNGVLTNIAVRPGDAVQVGSVLAEIDPKPFQIQHDIARAKVGVAEAQLKLAGAQFARTKALFDRGAASKEEYDRAAGEREVAEAQVQLARAESEFTAHRLASTKIIAPIAGVVVRVNTDAGNLVLADAAPVAVIVQTDPLFVAFDVDEKTLLAKVAPALKDGKLGAAVGFATDDGNPHAVAVDFVSPAIDPVSGTVRLRGKLPNPKGEFRPGMSVRVRLTTKPEK